MRLLVIVSDQDFVLNHFLVLVTAHPSRSRSQYWLWVDMIVGIRSEHKEVVVGSSFRLFEMGGLVKVIMDYLSQIN